MIFKVQIKFSNFKKLLLFSGYFKPFIANSIKYYKIMILVNVHFITVLLEFRSEQLKPINLDHDTNTCTVKPVLCDLPKEQ